MQVESNKKSNRLQFESNISRMQPELIHQMNDESNRFQIEQVSNRMDVGSNGIESNEDFIRHSVKSTKKNLRIEYD